MTAISFPRAIPSQLPVVGLSFTLDPMHELTPLRSGRTIAADLGPSLWRASWKSAATNDAALSEIRAWYATLLSYEAFYGYDSFRKYPRAYPTGWGSLAVGETPFDGICTLAAVATGLVLIDLEDLPIGFQLQNGDFLAFDYGTDSRALHMIVAGAVADGSGDMTVEVRPPIRAGWEAVAPAVRTVTLYKPAARMIIVPGSWSEQIDLGPIGKFSFSAIQEL